MSDPVVFELGNLALQSGQTLKSAQITYPPTASEPRRRICPKTRHTEPADALVKANAGIQA